MFIIGAGMAGLLAGVMNQDATILEARESVPDNHKAVFRVRNDNISNFTGISFKKVTVHKALWFDGEERQVTPRLANFYSMKVIGKIQQRSIFNLSPGERWIPPVDFVSRLAEKCAGRIITGVKIKHISRTSITCKGQKIYRGDDPIISTIPMPVLSKCTNYAIGVPFLSQEIVVNHYAVQNCDAYATIYYPDPKISTYRATLNGNLLITEGIAPPSGEDEQEVLKSFGIDQADRVLINHRQPNGKIIPIQEQIRTKFIYDNTVKYQIYSLGRFATWRPKVMIDAVFDDILVIRRLIEQGNYAALNYEQGD